MTHKDLIERMLNQTVKNGGDSWKLKHYGAFKYDASPLALLLKGFASYADKYFRRFESRLGDDYVLGNAWKDAMTSVRRLLDGELDELDGGLTDKLICEMLALEGFNPEGDKV